MRALVTGASGLIGRHTLAALQEAGWAVRTFHRGPAVEGCDHVAGDVRTNLDRLRDAARGCEAVVHLAGWGDVGASRRDPLPTVDVNATGTLHALEAARAAGAGLVLASSQRVYRLGPEPCREADPPQPDSPYGYAKWVAELWCRMQSEQYGVSTTALRFFSVYGPGQQANGGSGVVAIFARAALRGEPLLVQSAGRRDFTHVRDAAQGIVLALQRADAGWRTCNVGTGVGTSFRELATMVLEVTGSRSPVVDAIAEGPGQDLVPDISRARCDLGYEPRVALRAGLEQYVAWLRGQALEET